MWCFRLAPRADRYVDDILDYSERTFGGEARYRYRGLLQTAVTDLAVDPNRFGVRQRPELGRQARIYHLLNSRERAGKLYGVVRNPRHLLLFRLIEPDLVDIGRVLHDSMDLVQHVPGDYRQP